MMGGPGSGPKRRAGRPSKLTPELQDRIVKLIEAGNYMDTAAACCDVSRETFFKWMRRGNRQKHGPYRRFVDAVKKAEGLAEARALVRVRKAGERWWQAEAWYLERKFPNRWGRWERGSNEQPKRIDNARKAIQSKDVRDLLDEVARRIGMAGDAGGDGGEIE